MSSRRPVPRPRLQRSEHGVKQPFVIDTVGAGDAPGITRLRDRIAGFPFVNAWLGDAELLSDILLGAIGLLPSTP